ncbi:MAG: Holliday junction resolvase RuvX [Planctomycetes bacterium]|nr:Holliday junction resolvase RuvX [Planctomycetota bacterium]
MKYLAVDYGNKRTGLALCDRNETMASPLSVISEPSRVIEVIVEVVEDESIEGIVIGLPLNMDDSEGFQAKRVRAFGQVLSGKVEVPVLFHDERLSSFSASEKLAAMSLTRGRKKKRLDAVAAAEILEAFLEQKRDEAGGINTE